MYDWLCYNLQKNNNIKSHLPTMYVWIHPMHNNCCFSKTDALHVQQRVAPKSETSGLIKCTLGNIETIGKTNNETSKSWEQAWTKLYHALETSSDPCPLWAT